MAELIAIELFWLFRIGVGLVSVLEIVPCIEALFCNNWQEYPSNKFSDEKISFWNAALIRSSGPCKKF